MWADRERTEARLQALVADFLDSMDRRLDREAEVGVFALVAEVKERRTPEEIGEVLETRTRPEAAYTPEAEWTHSTWYRCSDLRDWIAAGLFRRAMLVADDFFAGEDEDEDE